ncbi:hypothetical protein Hanom_Chr16g01451201 [Helianthus anomalus]
MVRRFIIWVGVVCDIFNFVITDDFSVLIHNNRVVLICSKVQKKNFRKIDSIPGFDESKMFRITKQKQSPMNMRCGRRRETATKFL